MSTFDGICVQAQRADDRRRRRRDDCNGPRVEQKTSRDASFYPVAIPIYRTQFVADRIGFFKDAGLECKLIQGGSGVKTREIIASSQGDIGIGDITHPMQLRAIMGVPVVC